MYYFTDFNTQEQANEITHEDLDYEGIYDYILNEEDNEAVAKAQAYLNKYKY